MCQVHVSFGFDKQTKTESTYGIGPTVPTELWATQKQQAVRKLSQAQDKLSWFVLDYIGLVGNIDQVYLYLIILLFSTRLMEA